jgi:hypothetical protein
LIDACVDARCAVSKELDISADRIETWAVCDRDNYKGSYRDLELYAESKGVQLVFSDPQFENFLLQHIEFNKTAAKGKEIERQLEQEIIKHNLGNTYQKGSYAWLEKLLYNKPLSLESAIRNANKSKNQTKQPFFTVQKLVQRLINLAEP